LATTAQIVDFREVTFYISGDFFQISFEKWPKEPQKRIPHDLYNIVVKKKMIFEYTT
jgi:hypothetical protein